MRWIILLPCAVLIFVAGERFAFPVQHQPIQVLVDADLAGFDQAHWDFVPDGGLAAYSKIEIMFSGLVVTGSRRIFLQFFTGEGLDNRAHVPVRYRYIAINLNQVKAGEKPEFDTNGDGIDDNPHLIALQDGENAAASEAALAGEITILDPGSTSRVKRFRPWLGSEDSLGRDTGDIVIGSYHTSEPILGVRLSSQAILGGRIVVRAYR